MGSFELLDLELTFQGLLRGFGLLLATYWITWIVYTRVFHPLAGFPGPFWASVSRAWIVRSVIGGNPHETQRRLHARYGKTSSTHLWLALYQTLFNRSYCTNCSK
jgi:hypothetical protein